MNINLTYHRLLKSIMEYGYTYKDESRNQNLKQLSSASFDISLSPGFPLLTTKKMFTKGIVGELLWFLRGDNNIKYLVENNINIWNKDAYNWFLKSKPTMVKSRGSNTSPEIVEWEKDNPEHTKFFLGNVLSNQDGFGDVGRNYGIQWRKWTTVGKHMLYVDQIRGLINNLKSNPMSRRHIVTAWNPAELHQTALPPCHWAFEIIVRPSYKFEIEEGTVKSEYCFMLKWHQRSVDTFLGLPFNIASYGLLGKIIEELTGYTCTGLVADLSNIHIYEGHFSMVEQQLKNSPERYPLPTFKFSDSANLLFSNHREGKIFLDDVFEDLKIEDFIFENYNSYPQLKADMYEPNTGLNSNTTNNSTN